jgi:hypothetical protein
MPLSGMLSGQMLPQLQHITFEFFSPTRAALPIVSGAEARVEIQAPSWITRQTYLTAMMITLYAALLAASMADSDPPITPVPYLVPLPPKHTLKVKRPHSLDEDAFGDLKEENLKLIIEVLGGEYNVDLEMLTGAT